MGIRQASPSHTVISQRIGEDRSDICMKETGCQGEVML